MTSRDEVMIWRRRSFRAAWVVLLVSYSACAEGDGAKSRAGAYFKEGRQLASAGRYEDACRAFEKSLEVDAGIGTEFNLADCLEHVGEDMRARDLFLRVAARARSLGQTGREELARARAAALEATAVKPAVSIPPVKLEAMVVPGTTAPPETHPEEDFNRRLEADYAELAEINAALIALKTSALLIAPGHADARVQRVRAEIGALDRQLADEWQVAGRVANALARRRGPSLPNAKVTNAVASSRAPVRR